MRIKKKLINKISEMNPKGGELILTDPLEISLLSKYRYWEKGIPAWQYRKERVSDINDIMDIKGAFEDLENRRIKINEMQQELMREL